MTNVLVCSPLLVMSPLLGIAGKIHTDVPAIMVGLNGPGWVVCIGMKCVEVRANIFDGFKTLHWMMSGDVLVLVGKD